MFPHLKAELEAIASQELGDVLDSWPSWTPEQFSRLCRYLQTELGSWGMLSVEKGRDCGQPMGKIRTDARKVLALNPDSLERKL